MQTTETSIPNPLGELAALNRWSPMDFACFAAVLCSGRNREHPKRRIQAFLIWTLLLAGPLASYAQGQSSPALSLAQAQDLAASRSPTLAAAASQVEAAEGAIRQAGARRNPSLSAVVEDTHRETRNSTATLDFPLELGGKRAARVTAAERAKDVARAELDDAWAQVNAMVIGAYFHVLVAQERAKLASSSVELAGRAADAATKRVSAGKASPVEELRAQVDQANAVLEATEASAEFQSSRRQLSILWGDTEPQFTEVSGSTGAAPERPALSALLARLEQSPALLANRLEAERRRAIVDVERTRARPDVTLSVGSRRDNTIGRTQAVVGVSIPLPVFDRNQGGILEANKLAEKANAIYEAARLRLISDLQQSSSRLAVASASLRALQGTVLPAAQRAYEAATIGFQAGKFSFLDVLDAQRSLLQARTRYLNTLTAAYQAATAIDRIVGQQ